MLAKQFVLNQTVFRAHNGLHNLLSKQEKSRMGARERNGLCELQQKKIPIQLEKLFKWRKLLRETQKFLIAQNYGR